MSLSWGGKIDLRAHLRAVEAAAEDGIEAAAEHVLAESKPMVPVKTGTLRDSGRVSVDRDGLDTVAAVSYGTKWAVRTHEDLDDHHDQGSAKFLEEPLNRTRGEQLQELADHIRKALGG